FAERAVQRPGTLRGMRRHRAGKASTIEQETNDVHRDEPLPREEGIRAGLREGVAQPRFASRQGARIRRVPPAQGPRARRPYALRLAHDLAEPGDVRSLDA